MLHLGIYIFLFPVLNVKFLWLYVCTYNLAVNVSMKKKSFFKSIDALFLLLNINVVKCVQKKKSIWSTDACYLQLDVRTTIISSKTVPLTAHNWQKWKKYILTFPCHKIYRVDTDGLSISNYTLNITIFVNIWNLGTFFEKLIFCQ